MLSEQLRRGDFGFRLASNGEIASAWYEFSEMTHATRRSVIQHTMLSPNPLSAHLGFSDRNTLHVVEPEDFALGRFFESQRNYLQDIAEQATGIYIIPFPDEFVVLKTPSEERTKRVVDGLKKKPYGRIIVASADQNGEMLKATYSPYAHMQTGMDLSDIKQAMSGDCKIIIVRAV